MLLHAALRDADPSWRVLFECDLLRLERRADVVVVTDRAIVVLEFKHGARGFEPKDLRQAEDYALDLHDFHAGNRAIRWCRCWSPLKRHRHASSRR